MKLVLGLSASVFVIAMSSSVHAHQDAVQKAVQALPVAELDDIDEVSNEDAEDDGSDSITVVGTRQRGVTLGDIEPELTLTETDIQAYGASTFADLLAALEPETGSGRGRGGGGRPIVLLNGVRVANFGEIARYPTEALARTEVLPEETAVRYGYRPDQRVVNFVLKPGFKSLSVEVEGQGSTAGGRRILEVESGWLQFGDNRRTSIDGEITTRAKLLERSRNIIQDGGGLPYALSGNVAAATFGDEIDPGLSALVGETVTVAALPLVVGSSIELSDFVDGANAEAVSDDTSARTLLGEVEAWELGAAHNRTIFENVSFGASLNTTNSVTESLLGFAEGALIIPDDNSFSPFSDDVVLYRAFDGGNVLTRTAESTTYEAGLTASGNKGEWRWSVVGNYDVSQSETITDRDADVTGLQAALDDGSATFNPFADVSDLISVTTDIATTETQTAGVDGTLNGFMGRTKAGRISGTLRGNLRSTQFETRSVVDDLTQRVDLSRDTALVRGNIDIPIADRDLGVLPALGQVSVGLQAEAQNFSDVGTLSTVGGSVRWTFWEPLTVTASFRTEDGAPSITQLGNPVILTPNSRVFDFQTGETVEVTRVSGGNPDLVDDSRSVLGLGLRFRPFEEMRLTFSTDYTDETIDDPISSFPSLTPEIEAAFADRFVRDDVTGALISIDQRPINYQESTRRELRSAIRYSKRLQANSSAAGRGRPGGPRGGRGGRQQGGGFFSATLNHTWRLEEQIVIRDGVPVLDLLDGSATGSFGGQPEHEMQARLFTVYNGLGLNISHNWKDGTFVSGDGDDGAGDLRFSDLATSDVRVFLDGGRSPSIARKYPWLKGTRISLSVDNMFDNKLEVRDAMGAVPLTYQDDLIDPLGRTIELSIRKLFY